MTELEKYQAVNACETYDELADVIEQLADGTIVQGRSRGFDAQAMSSYCRNFDNVLPNQLTRMWGIRQQALYIQRYQTIMKKN